MTLFLVWHSLLPERNGEPVVLFSQTPVWHLLLNDWLLKKPELEKAIKISVLENAKNKKREAVPPFLTGSKRMRKPHDSSVH
jgi:hypothetical protein